MPSSKQRAARRNIKKAAKAATRKRTVANLPKRTRTGLGQEGAKAAKRKTTIDLVVATHCAYGPDDTPLAKNRSEGRTISLRAADNTDQVTEQDDPLLKGSRWLNPKQLEGLRLLLPSGAV
jgi:hypothetical protein